ncbi:MAG TPA: hypothetical protein VF552_04150 [Allosphingosinicella sp.]|jgi:hypothetical protein
MTSLLLPLLLLAAPEPQVPGAAALCPLEVPEYAAGLACIAETGRNWSFAFAYPRVAAELPGLARELDARRGAAREEFATLEAYAAEHQEGRFYHQEVYRFDADRPEFVALRARIDEYAGGAHPWSGTRALIWDRGGDRQVAFADLFADPAAARAEIARLYCPAIVAVRRRKAEESGGRFSGGCGEPPEDGSPVGGADGRIDTLRLSPGEMDGYASGPYEVLIPVTPRLLQALKPRYRAAFRVSRRTAAVGCNEGVPDPACAASRR